MPLEAPAQAALLSLIAIVSGLLVRAQVQAPITVDGEVLYTRPASGPA